MAIKKLPANISIALKQTPRDRRMMKGIEADMKRCDYDSMSEFCRKCFKYVHKHGVNL